MKSIQISPGTIVSVCDKPDNEIEVKGRTWKFDFDYYLGPLWLKKNGTARKCQFPNKAVWNKFEKWLEQQNENRRH